MTVFEGEMYIRPMGRGVCLGPDLEDFEDWIFTALDEPWTQGGVSIPVRITVERLSDARETNENADSSASTRGDGSDGGHAREGA